MHQDTACTYDHMSSRKPLQNHFNNILCWKFKHFHSRKSFENGICKIPNILSRDPIQWGIFHLNSNSMGISASSHPNYNEVIATKLCTWHGFAAMACAKICCYLRTTKWITSQCNFHRRCIVIEKLLLKSAPGRSELNQFSRIKADTIIIYSTFYSTLLYREEVENDTYMTSYLTATSATVLNSSRTSVQRWNGVTRVTLKTKVGDVLGGVIFLPPVVGWYWLSWRWLSLEVVVWAQGAVR